MRIPRIYIDQLRKHDQKITISNEINHYLVNVLRLKENHPIILFNGVDELEFDGKIISSSKKQTEIEITETKPVSNMPKVNIHLLQALSKGDRFDYAIQKATELGVSSITPLMTERVDVKLPADRLAKRQQHWQKIIISACEQSNRVILPELNEAINLSNLQPPKDSLSFILSPTADKKLSSYQKQKPQDIYIIIGPEGGLTKEEINLMIEKNAQAITLGPRILRTETAPVAMISLVQYLWGDF
ncbi:16S rRNA (uracil(1498)-N(3))-methyltransferase [Thiotrichales bacterium 19S9-12]|nr:16S rRNA (uracil(1498)-N(3))-methyltransferase [Thiotrichales bacterium 19S9-11]MCF6811694.1 16S rRNA (uracil(1498)-N(3))-methyltransferase [Thiotrichales bacterium 19S9-12]